MSSPLNQDPILNRGTFYRQSAIHDQGPADFTILVEHVLCLFGSDLNGHKKQTWW